MWIGCCCFCLKSRCTCVCVSSSLLRRESTTPCIPDQVCLCVCLQMCPSRCVSVWVREKERLFLLWAPCCHCEKTIMERARASGRPPTNIIQAHSFLLICMDASGKLHLFFFHLETRAKCFLNSLMWNYAMIASMCIFNLVNWCLLGFGLTCTVKLKSQ